MQFCQRSNGGAGPNKCVKAGQPILKISMYEAAFCCTMRYAEGMLEYSRNTELFGWDSAAEVISDEIGRSFIDDVLLVEYNGEKLPIFSCNTIPEEEALAIELKIF